MFDLTPLWADAGDWVKAVIIGGGILLYLMSQLASMIGDDTSKSKARTPRNDPNREPYDGDIEEFVNQASGYVMQPEPVAATVVPGRDDVRQRHLKGSSVDMADERIQSRLHDTFDHEVGTLDHQEAAAVEMTHSPAEEISEMLRTPQGMRNAIILGEILTRPDFDNW